MNNVELRTPQFFCKICYVRSWEKTLLLKIIQSYEFNEELLKNHVSLAEVIKNHSQNTTETKAGL